MTGQQSQSGTWFDRYNKVLIPLISGVVLAVLGYFTQHFLGKLQNERANRRLVVELQLEREKAESDLRREVFNQAITALISTEDDKSHNLSKRLLKLELLALNFGDSLALSPLFIELNREFDSLKGLIALDVPAYKKRLRALARRVSGNQIMALSQHGTVKELTVYLNDAGDGFPSGDEDYRWPDDAVFEQFGIAGRADLGCPNGNICDLVIAAMKRDGIVSNNNICEKMRGAALWWLRTRSRSKAEENRKICDLVEKRESEALDPVDKEIVARCTTVRLCDAVDTGLAEGETEFNGIRRKVTVALSKPDTVQRSVHVDIEIEWADMSVARDFDLNFFNFPKIDNTRLSDNQRFSMVLNEFDVDEDPFLKITWAIFPAEYSSMRDRQTMHESVTLLNKTVDMQN